MNRYAFVVGLTCLLIKASLATAADNGPLSSDVVPKVAAISVSG